MSISFPDRTVRNRAHHQIVILANARNQANTRVELDPGMRRDDDFRDEVNRLVVFMAQGSACRFRASPFDA